MYRPVPACATSRYKTWLLVSAALVTVPIWRWKERTRKVSNRAVVVQSTYIYHRVIGNLPLIACIIPQVDLYNGIMSKAIPINKCQLSGYIIAPITPMQMKNHIIDPNSIDTTRLRVSRRWGSGSSHGVYTIPYDVIQKAATRVAIHSASCMAHMMKSATDVMNVADSVGLRSTRRNNHCHHCHYFWTFGRCCQQSGNKRNLMFTFSDSR